MAHASEPRGPGADDAVVVLRSPAEDLLADLRAALVDPGLRCLVLEGTDVARPDLDEAVLAVVGSATPVVAVVTGEVAGPAAALALAADLRVVAPTATLRVEPLLGGASWTLPRAVGVAEARLRLLSARPFTAEDTLATGLASALDADPAGAALALAAELAVRPAVELGATKRSLDPDQDLADALAREARLRAVVARADSPG